MSTSDLTDDEREMEIALVGDVVAAAADRNEPLTTAEIDAALGIADEAGEGSTPSDGAVDTN